MPHQFERNPNIPPPPPPPSKGNTSEQGENKEKLPQMKAVLYAEERIEYTEDRIDPDRLQAGRTVRLKEPKHSIAFVYKAEQDSLGNQQLKKFSDHSDSPEGLANMLSFKYIKDGRAPFHLVLMPEIDQKGLKELQAKDVKTDSYETKSRALTAEEQQVFIESLKEFCAKRKKDYELELIRIKKAGRTPLPPPPPMKPPRSV